MKPLITIAKDVEIVSVDFPNKKIHVSNDHMEGYLLIFRKTIWNLDHDFKFSITLSNGKIYHVKVKAGFKFDFASTPKLIWSIYPPFDERYGAPALGHDIFYGAEVFAKWFNDQFLVKGMNACGATLFDQTCFDVSVSSCGWLTYVGHTKASVEHNRNFIEIKEA